MAEITRYKLDAAFSALKDFDFLAKDDDFIEVVLWNNGEGFDVSCAEQCFGLTWGNSRP